MDSPKLAQLAQIAEIVAAVAVVFSLIYVGYELKENTSAVRAGSIQAITTGSQEALLGLALDAELARIVRIGSIDRSELTLDEQYRFGLFSRQRWLFFQGVWMQKRLDVVDEKTWMGYERIVCSILNSPGTREDWPYHKNVLDSEFVAHIEGCTD